MCGRYQMDEDMQEIIERFDIESVFKDADTRIGEVFPGSRAPVVIRQDSHKTLTVMKWGLHPYFMDKDIINTRRESLFTKKMYHDAIMYSRCIIPANHFYEWEKVSEKKEKRRIYDDSRKILAFAGIFTKEADTQAFTIITMDALGDIKRVHNRMPAVISVEDEQNWLKEGLARDEILAILDRALPVLKIA